MSFSKQPPTTEIQDDEEIDQESQVKLRNQRQEKIQRLQDALNKESKMKLAIEDMLQLYGTKDPAASKDAQNQLDVIQAKINQLQKQLQVLTRTQSRHSQQQQPVQLRMSTTLSHMPKNWQRNSNFSRGETLSIASERKRPQLSIMKGVLPNLSEVLHKIKSRDADPQVRLDAANNLLKLVKSVRMAQLQSFDEVLLCAHRQLLGDQMPEVKALGYRVIRYLLIEKSAVQLSWKYGLELYLLKSLCRDAKGEVEREQSFKLIRAYIDHQDGVQYLPRSLIQVMVSVAEQVDDTFRYIALETLCELSLRDVALVASCGGLKVLFQCLMDGSRQFVDLVIPVVLVLVDHPDTRQYIRPCTELEILFSNFTDAYSRAGITVPPQAAQDVKKTAAQNPGTDPQFIACCHVVAGLLRSWNGLFYLCGGGINEGSSTWSVKFLVESLALPYDDTKRIVLDLLIETFGIDIPKWLPDIVQARGNTALSSATADGTLKKLLIKTVKEKHQLQEISQSLINHHTAFLLNVFIDSQLFEVLMDTVELSSNKVIVLKTVILLRELLHLCNYLLSPARSSSIYSLAKLFKLSTLYLDGELRIQATTALVHIDQGDSLRCGLVVKSATSATAAKEYSSEAYFDVEDMSVRMINQNEDSELKQLLTDSQVLTAKESTQWNWDCIMELLYGPLQNLHRFEEILKTTVFVKKLLSFYRPEQHRFSDLKVGKTNGKYVQCIRLLFELLLGSQEGTKYFAENKFLTSITACFDQLNPINNFVEEQLFSQERLVQTMSAEYFNLIGLLCRDLEGQELLERFSFYDRLYRLSELKSRDDIICLIIKNLDYSYDGHPRIILFNVLTSGSKAMRLFATQHLLVVLRNGSDFTWAIEFLVTQLYDPSIEISEKAVLVLEEACQNNANLCSLIEWAPRMDHLGDICNPLLLRYLSLDQGFTYLKDVQYIEMEYQYWLREGNYKYATQAELFIAYTQQPKVRVTDFSKTFDSSISKEQLEQHDEFDATLSHFFGNVCATTLGCQYIKDCDLMETFRGSLSQFMRSNNSSASDTQTLFKIKGIVWALGNIGSSICGAQLLIDSGLFILLIELGADTSILSLKSVCIMSLGLVATNRVGALYLQGQGWDSACLVNQTCKGYALPSLWFRYIQLPVWRYKQSQITQPCAEYFLGFDVTQLEALKHIGNLSNHILASASSKFLTKMKHDQPTVFQDLEFYIKVMRILSVYHYKLTARRYINELFDSVHLTDYNLDGISVSDSQALKIKHTLQDADVNLNKRPQAQVKTSTIKSSSAFAPADGTASGVSKSASKQRINAAIVQSGFRV